ncbi:MAG: potassium channel family protein [Chloroflexota bacterium]
MFVIVVGGGRVGRYLAELLKNDGHRVSLVEKNPQRCEELRKEIDVNVVCGDGNDPDVLRQADIRKADALAAVTSDDEDNLVIGLLGRREFGVKRVVGRINNPRNEWLFNKRMGIDAAVHPARIIAQLLEEEVTVGEIATLLKLRRGNLSLVEAVVTEGAPAANLSLADVELPMNSVLVAVIRDGTVIVPTGETILRVGDEVVALTDVDSQPALASALTGR